MSTQVLLASLKESLPTYIYPAICFIQSSMLQCSAIGNTWYNW